MGIRSYVPTLWEVDWVVSSNRSVRNVPVGLVRAALTTGRCTESKNQARSRPLGNQLHSISSKARRTFLECYFDPRKSLMD